MKRTKKAIDNNNTSGAIRVEPEYEEEIREIVHNDDSYLPEMTVSQEKRVRKSDLFPTSSTSRPRATTSPSSSASMTSLTLATPEESSSPTEDLQLTNIPLRRQRKKTLQETLMEKFIEHQQEKSKMIESFLKKKLEIKSQHNKQQREDKQKRHLEKLQRLDALINLQRKNI